MVYGNYANNYSYWGESKPTYNWGPPIVALDLKKKLKSRSHDGHDVFPG